jgi:hypothetical protein
MNMLAVVILADSESESLPSAQKKAAVVRRDNNKNCPCPSMLLPNKLSR